MNEEELFMQELMADPEYRAWCDQRDYEDNESMDRMTDDEIEALSEAPEHPVFVYGSLKTGFGNHDCLDGSKFLGNALTEYDCYVMHSYGAFPAVSAVEEGPAYFISGELYLVSRSTLEVLDRLEGNGHFYTRRLTNIQLDNGQVMEAWMYLVPASKNSSFENPRAVVKRRVYTDEDASLQTWVQE